MLLATFYLTRSLLHANTHPFLLVVQVPGVQPLFFAFSDDFAAQIAAFQRF
jgi:hypothetical protein